MSDELKTEIAELADSIHRAYCSAANWGDGWGYAYADTKRGIEKLVEKALATPPAP